MENVVGRVAGILAIIAVPFLGVAWLQSREPATRAVPEPVGEVVFAPAALYDGPPQDGLTFVSDGRLTDVRGFARLALYVPEKEPPSAFTRPGRFVATFRGALRVPTRDRYTFTRAGNGELALRIGDREVEFGKPLRLKKGEHALEARFTAPPTGEQFFRLYWECSEFGREPIPATALRHGRSPSLEQFAALRRGRDLALELRCGACHVGAPLPDAAPSLADAGARLRPAWTKRWLTNPGEFRPGSSMPRLVTDRKDAIDIAAFLASLGQPEPWAEFAPEAERAGAALFAARGCVACHTLPGHADAATVSGRTPLAGVGAKWHPAALVAFLRAPQRVVTSTAMPDCGLDVEESQAVAAFLLARDRRVLPQFGVADLDRGRRRAAELGCARCHALPVANTLVAPQRAITTAGSVDCSFAKYELAAGDRAALREFLGGRVGFRRSAAEYAEARLADSCASCHAWRGRAARLATVGSEVEGLLPKDAHGFGRLPPPDLTGVGGKLRQEWLVAFLGGTTPDRPRPWLHMRMPRLRRPDASLLARGLAQLEGFGPEETPAVVEVAGEAAAIGRRLLGKDEGFACVQCHAVAGQEPSEAFEAPGVDLALAARRLRHEWYHRWMRDPTRVDPATKMTKFADVEGRTGLTEILGGDGRAQFEAIWRHLRALGR